ncbi:MAG: undecaprenyl-diphosphate phosphatase [Oscillospiraceae bacterium]
MELGWIKSCVFGFLSGLLDIFPVSAEAHRVLLLKFFGLKAASDIMNLLIHIAVFAALYYSSQTHLVRMRRARELSRIPKNKRKRPLDIRSMMDGSMLKTMMVPALLGVYFRKYTTGLSSNLMLIALFLFLNGVILYLPQFFPTSNRDSRTLSRIEGLLMGLGGMASAVPGISAIGATTSIGSVCGVERTYGLNMALMMNMAITAGLIVFDLLGIVNNGFGVFSFLILIRYIISAAAAFGGTILGINIMRKLAIEQGYSVFGVYCWGLALFTFILNLIA